MKRTAVLEGPPHALGLLDLKPADLADDLLRREENVRLRGPAPALGEVQEVVAHHEQGAVRPQRVHRVTERRPALGGRELQVKHADQIMGTRRRHPGDHIGLDPVDLDAVGGGEVARHRQGHGREVHRRHAPATLGEPHGVAARSARQVQRSRRGEVGDLGDEEPIGRRGRVDAVSGGVAAVPVLAPGVGSHALSVRPYPAAPGQARAVVITAGGLLPCGEEGFHQCHSPASASST